MLISITSKGLVYYNALQLPRRVNDVEDQDEVVLHFFVHESPLDEDELYNILELRDGRERLDIKSVLRRLFEAGYLDQVEE